MEKWSKVNIWIILVLGLGLRLIALNQSFWMDEAITATVVKNFSLIGVVTKFIASDTHPPLYYLILRIWSLIFGYSEISLRFPSVIFGVITIFIVYKIGLLFSKKTAYISAFLMAAAPLHIYYSQEARMYALTTFLVSAAVYFFLENKWLFLSIFFVLIGATDYLPLLILIPFFVFTLFSRKKSEIENFVKAIIPLMLFILVWIPYFIKQITSTGAYLKKFPEWKSVLGSASIKDLALVWVKFILGRISFDNKIMYFGFVFIISLPLLYLLFKTLTKDKKIYFIWLWFIIPILIAFVGAFFVPGFSYFRLIFVIPALYLLLSYGLTQIKNNKILLAFLLILNISFSLTYLINDKFWREDWKTAVPFLENKLADDEVVLVSYGEPFTPYLWYSKYPGRAHSFDQQSYLYKSTLYSLDYLMDLTDPQRKNYEKLVNLGFKQQEVYNFRGVGQIRYWTRN